MLRVLTCLLLLPTPAARNLPAIDSSSTSFSSTSFVMAHNAGTGYAKLGMVWKYRSFFSTAWFRCQKGSFYEQLDNGARALYLRVTLDEEGSLRFKHGDYIIS